VGAGCKIFLEAGIKRNGVFDEPRRIEAARGLVVVKYGLAPGLRSRLVPRVARRRQALVAELEVVVPILEVLQLCAFPFSPGEG